jgi:intein/homing endonuclease
LLADGSWKSIQDVRLLDSVVTADRTVCPVIQTMVAPSCETVVKLSLWGHGHLRLTCDRPVLTKRGYVNAGDLLVTDFIAIPRYLPSIRTEALRPHEYVEQKHLKIKREVRLAQIPGRKPCEMRMNPLPNHIVLSKEFGRLVGLFLAEGSCDASKVRWTFSLDEKETLVADTVKLIHDLFEMVPHVAERIGAHSINVTLYGTAWSRFFEAICGNGAGKKCIHPLLTSGPDEFLEAMLRGWLDGDGWRYDRVRNYEAGVSISHDLALSMYQLAVGLGRSPVIQWQKPTINSAAKTRQPRWTVCFSTTGENWRMKSNSEYMWRKVRSISAETFCGPVYDLGVEGAGSFVAEGIGVGGCGSLIVANAA